MEIRNLQTSDFFKVATIISKITAEAMKDIVGGTQDTAQVGAAFISSAFKHAETDVKIWLASLIGKTPAEFDEMPFDTPLEIIEVLAERENLKSFFLRAKGLAGKVSK